MHILHIHKLKQECSFLNYFTSKCRVLQFFYASTHLDLFSHWICSGAWRWKGNSIKIHLNRAPDLLQIKSGKEKSIMTQWMIEFCLQSTNGSSFFFYPSSRYPPSRLSLWPKCSKTCLMKMNNFLEQTALWNISLQHWKSIRDHPFKTSSIFSGEGCPHCQQLPTLGG